MNGHKKWQVALMDKLMLEKPKCEHQYLPDEDGTVYTCGSDNNVINVGDGTYLCDLHRGHEDLGTSKNFMD